MVAVWKAKRTVLEYLKTTFGQLIAEHFSSVKSNMFRFVKSVGIVFAYLHNENLKNIKNQIQKSFWSADDFFQFHFAFLTVDICTLNYCIH